MLLKSFTNDQPGIQVPTAGAANEPPVATAVRAAMRVHGHRRLPVDPKSRSARGGEIAASPGVLRRHCACWRSASGMPRAPRSPGQSSPTGPNAAAAGSRSRYRSDLTGMIALTGSVESFRNDAGRASRRTPGQASASPGQAPGAPLPAVDAIPRVIPLEPLRARARRPRALRSRGSSAFPTDKTGLRARPPAGGGPAPSRQEEVSKDLTNLIEMVKDPEAEISLVEGQTKILQIRRELSRIVIANPNVADVET